jgi:hypothetical protein
MIFEPTMEDSEYSAWFAWRPVRLYGPDEWDRCRRGRFPRWVWLTTVYRMRVRPRTYYALPEPNQ